MACLGMKQKNSNSNVEFIAALSCATAADQEDYDADNDINMKELPLTDSQSSDRNAGDRENILQTHSEKDYDADDDDDMNIKELTYCDSQSNYKNDDKKKKRISQISSENHQTVKYNKSCDKMKKSRKYKNPLITFPSFPPDKILRISDYDKLSPKYPSRTWSSVRREKERRKQLYGDSFQEYKKLPPQEEMVETDEEKKFAQPVEIKPRFSEPHKKEKTSSVALWRFGPARMWYDILNVPENGENFDYGFKLKNSEENSYTEFKDEYPGDVYLMVTQKEWEKDVIWNSDTLAKEVEAKLRDKNSIENWFMTRKTEPPEVAVRKLLMLNENTSSGQVYSAVAGRNVTKRESINQMGNRVSMPKQQNDKCHIEPLENSDLVNYRWEDDVIWDSEQMDHIPEPKILTLDANDENIVLNIPPEPSPEVPKQIECNSGKKDPRRLPLLVKKEKENYSPEEPTPTTIKRDPFDISNDEYYNPKLTQNYSLKPAEGVLIQHSIPALDLFPLYYPTTPGITKLRNYHRPMLKWYCRGPLSRPGPHGVFCLTQHIKKMQKERNRVRAENGGGEMFFMKSPHDLSAQDGEIMLTEYSEEFPPLMMQTGMAFKIKNYYKRKAGKDPGAPEYEYGETAYAHTSPFLGNLAPGQSLQTLESNIFRAPLFLHSMPETDFLIIRTRNGYFIRDVNVIYTVGQELPLVEVPQPKCKTAAAFLKNFLQVYIYRLFQRSTDNPRRCKLEDIKKAFPDYSESSIRKRLNHCAEFKRTGNDAQWWVLHSDFRLPTEEEIRALVSPEEYCAYYSMLAAHQRLKDAGYGEKLVFSDTENDGDIQEKIDDEVKAAPWNTTRAFIAAMNGKCLLQVNGIADPTGCGEGFSYIRVPNKSLLSKEDDGQIGKKTVVGTDADLRKMSQARGRQLLRQLGQSDEEIKKLNRWEVICLVRALSTQSAKEGDDELRKFARGIRPTHAQSSEMYKSACQRVFDLQNRVLSSNEVLSTDEGSTSDDDLDIEEMGRNIESILSNKKTFEEVSHEQEEIQRRELKKFICKDSTETTKKKDKSKTGEEDKDSSNQESNYEGKMLVITRKFKTPEGKEYVRTETVRKPAVISRYVQIQKSNDPNIIKKYCPDIDAKRKEEFRKEKKRIQDQLRRLNRNEEKYKLESAPKRPRKEPPNVNMKCGACGAAGHIRTNRVCPHYQFMKTPIQVTMNEETEQVSNVLDDDELVKLDETKIVFSKRLVEHVKDANKKSVKLTFRREYPVPAPPRPVRKNENKGNIREYNKQISYKTSKLTRISRNPQIALTSALEEVWKKMKAVPEFAWFVKPVDVRTVPNYLEIVKKPMDLTVIQEKLQKSVYKSRQQFLEDIVQIYENSKLYNGVNDIVTRSALNLVEACGEALNLQDSYLMNLEVAIVNQTKNEAFKDYSEALQRIVEKYMKTVPESWPFFRHDNKGFMKDYDNVEHPMNCKIILEKIKSFQYKVRSEFLDDVELILKNSISCRGPNAPLTKKANEILDACRKGLKVYGPRLDKLEAAIAAFRSEETDSEVQPAGNTNDAHAEQEYQAEKDDREFANDLLANDLLLSDDDEEPMQCNITAGFGSNERNMDLSYDSDESSLFDTDNEDKNSKSYSCSQVSYNDNSLSVVLDNEELDENYSLPTSSDAKSSLSTFIKPYFENDDNGKHTERDETSQGEYIDYDLIGSNDSFIDVASNGSLFASSQNVDNVVDQSVDCIEEEVGLINVGKCNSDEQLALNDQSLDLSDKITYPQSSNESTISEIPKNTKMDELESDKTSEHSVFDFWF